MVHILAQPLSCCAIPGAPQPTPGPQLPSHRQGEQFGNDTVNAWEVGAGYLSHSRCRAPVSFCPLVFSSTSLSVQLGDVQGSTDLDPAAPESVGHLSCRRAPRPAATAARSGPAPRAAALRAEASRRVNAGGSGTAARGPWRPRTAQRWPAGIPCPVGTSTSLAGCEARSLG